MRFAVAKVTGSAGGKAVAAQLGTEGEGRGGTDGVCRRQQPSFHTPTTSTRRRFRQKTMTLFPPTYRLRLAHHSAPAAVIAQAAMS